MRIILIVISSLFFCGCATLDNKLTKNNFRNFVESSVNDYEFYTENKSEGKISIFHNYNITPVGQPYAKAIAFLNKKGSTTKIEAKSIEIEIKPPTNSSDVEKYLDQAINELGSSLNLKFYIKYKTSTSSCSSTETEQKSSGEWIGNSLYVETKNENHFYNTATVKFWVFYFNDLEDIKKGVLIKDHTLDVVTIEPFWELYYNLENRKKNKAAYPHKIAEKPNSFGCNYFSSYRSIFEAYKKIQQTSQGKK